jgi:hypothetical protein
MGLREGVKLSDTKNPEQETPAAVEPPATNSNVALSAARAPALATSSAGEKIARLRDPGVSSLTAALRRARIDNAERSLAAEDLRGAEIVKLEILKERLLPVLMQLPRDCDLFDVGVSPGDRPRLFIDQIGFIEMERDRRAYRFLQDTRHGRITIADTENADVIVEAVSAYIAHRLIERERALASDYASGGAAAAFAAKNAGDHVASTAPTPEAAEAAAPLWRRFLPEFLFFVEVLGAAIFFVLLFVLCLWFYRNFLLQ